MIIKPTSLLRTVVSVSFALAGLLAVLGVRAGAQEQGGVGPREALVGYLNASLSGRGVCAELSPATVATEAYQYTVLNYGLGFRSRGPALSTLDERSLCEQIRKAYPKPEVDRPFRPEDVSVRLIGSYAVARVSGEQALLQNLTGSWKVVAETETVLGAPEIRNGFELIAGMPADRAASLIDRWVSRQAQAVRSQKAQYLTLLGRSRPLSPRKLRCTGRAARVRGGRATLRSARLTVVGREVCVELRVQGRVLPVDAQAVVSAGVVLVSRQGKDAQFFAGVREDQRAQLVEFPEGIPGKASAKILPLSRWEAATDGAVITVKFRLSRLQARRFDGAFRWSAFLAVDGQQPALDGYRSLPALPEDADLTGPLRSRLAIYPRRDG